MTVKDVYKALEGLDEDAPITFDIRADGNLQYFVEGAYFTDKVVGTKFANEITLSLYIS